MRFDAIFALIDGEATPEDRLCYELVAASTSSLESLDIMIGSLARALELASRRARDPQVALTGPVSTQAQLDELLGMLPEEIQDPLVRVHFEGGGWQSSGATRRYKVADWKDLKPAVDHFRVLHYAQKYAELRDHYEARGWPEIPAKLDPASTNLGELTKGLKDFEVWLRGNDPGTVFLKEQEKLLEQKPLLKTHVAGALSKFFATSSPIPQVQVVKVLLSKVQSSCRGDIVGASGRDIMAGSQFLKIVSQAVGEDPWKSSIDPNIQSIVQSIGSWGSTSTNNVWRRLELTKRLLLTGLQDSSLAPSVAALFQSFLNVSDGPKSAKDWLSKRLEDTCAVLLAAVNPDLGTLEAYDKALSQPIGILPLEYARQVVEAAWEALNSMPLRLKAPPNPSVRLFAFSDWSAIWKKTGRGRPHTAYELAEESFSTVIVGPDAKESGQVFYRPVYAVLPGEPPLLKFFNLPADPMGFYYWNVEQPGLVSSGSLSFDLLECTVNGLKKVPAGGHAGLSEGTLYKIAQPTESKANLYSAIRHLSKWRDLAGQRSYDVVYQTRAGGQADVHLVWRLPAGSGFSRADGLDDDLCLWRGGNDDYPRLGEFLGLPPTRRVEVANANQVRVGGKTWDHQVTTQTIGPFEYQFLTLSNDKESQVYVLANTPHPNLPVELDSILERQGPKSTRSDSAVVHKILDFEYYRRVEPGCSANPKVIKRLPKEGSGTRRPGPGDGIVIEDGLGIDLPVSFRLAKNLKAFRAWNSNKQAELKNKGNALARGRRERASAGGVMKNVRPFLQGFERSGSTLPATVFANWALAKSQQLLADWQSLKDSKRGTLPVNQEWCHLQGHADGGPEELNNFVSGSFHCNTEQLAIESGQRITTHVSAEGCFKLLTTAYLFDDQGRLLNGDYLAGGERPAKLRRSNSGAAVAPQARNAPLAAFIRYKVHRCRDGSTVKCFEHIFEAQSEFMDKHQYNILTAAARFAVAGIAAFEAWYSEQKAAAQPAGGS